MKKLLLAGLCLVPCVYAAQNGLSAEEAAMPMKALPYYDESAQAQPATEQAKPALINRQGMVTKGDRMVQAAPLSQNQGMRRLGTEGSRRIPAHLRDLNLKQGVAARTPLAR
jgi:hypothetical protein